MPTIVVGYVPTPEGQAALDRGVHEATVHGARLLVVNVAHSGTYVDDGVAPENDLSGLRERLAAAGVEHEVRQPVSGGDGGAELLEIVAAEDADMLVIGTRHRSAVGKLLLGSTAQHLLLEANCPVLAVKAASAR